MEQLHLRLKRTGTSRSCVSVNACRIIVHSWNNSSGWLWTSHRKDEHEMKCALKRVFISMQWDKVIWHTEQQATKYTSGKGEEVVRASLSTNFAAIREDATLISTTAQYTYGSVFVGYDWRQNVTYVDEIPPQLGQSPKYSLTECSVENWRFIWSHGRNLL